MTPRRLDRPGVGRGGIRATLVDDRMLRHAIERILAQLVDVAVSINSHVAAATMGQAPRDYRDSFDVVSAAGVPEHRSTFVRFLAGCSGAERAPSAVGKVTFTAASD